MKNAILLSAIAVWLFVLQPIGAVNGGDEQKDSKVSSEAKVEWYDPTRPLSKALADLAKAGGQDPEVFRSYVLPDDFAVAIDRDTVRKIEIGNKVYVVAVLAPRPLSVPGSCPQLVVLVTPKGKILDTIECNINSRYGATKTEVLPKPDTDGASIVIRFEGREFPPGNKDYWHNWHSIVFRDKHWTFWEPQNTKAEITKPGIWNTNGLCRIGIADDKFKVIFPKLEIPDLSKAKSLRIIYYQPNENEKSLVVDDERKVAEMCKEIAIIETNRHDVEGLHPRRHAETMATMVNFSMPDGKTIQLGFLKKKVLGDTLSGDTYVLDSRRFYESVSKAVSKAEGRQINLELSGDQRLGEPD